MERSPDTSKEEAEEYNALIVMWQKAFKRATDFDTWGQPIEALDIYHRLSKQLYVQSNSKDSTLFSRCQKKVLEKIALCLDARRNSLNITDSDQEECISLKDLKQLEKTFELLLVKHATASDDCQNFPVDVAAASAKLKCLFLNNACQQDISPHKDEGYLLPKPLPASGKTYLTVCIEYIGVKDSSHFLDPHMSIFVKSQSGETLSCIQNTPVASSKVDSAIKFDTNVHIEKALENLPKGFAIFFEFKHFKPKKNVSSTYCWAFLEQDEVNEGPLALELYKKPTDYQRKSLKLLTVKPLFIHLNLHLYK